MTWNTGLIDPDNFDLSDGFRAEKICDRIITENVDVIILQEVWDREDQEFFEECLKESGYDVIFDEENSGEIGGNGLVTIVRSELIPVNSSIGRETTFIEFECNTGAAEAISDKGFLHTKITLEYGCEMDIFNTHLQAGSGNHFGGDIFNRPDRECVRFCQIDQMVQYINGNTCGPTLVGGDFNINIQEFAGDPGCFDMNEREELISLFNQVDGVLTNTISNPPSQVTGTSLTGGGILDFFVLANDNDNVVNITSETIGVFDCEESWVVKRVVSAGPSGSFIRVVFEGETREEAEEFVANNQFSSQLFIEQIIDCADDEFNALDLSDHLPVRTCLSYDCQPNECDEEDPCQNVICPAYNICNNGVCEPLPNACQTTGCPIGYKCVGFECIPI